MSERRVEDGGNEHLNAAFILAKQQAFAVERMEAWSLPLGTITLCDVVARTDTLRAACTRCDHSGQHPVNNLIKRYGPQFLLRDGLSVLSQGCPVRESICPDAPCGIYYVDLPLPV
jgi:hypothetical protein